MSEERRKSNDVLTYEIQNMHETVKEMKIDNTKEHKYIKDVLVVHNGRLKVMERWFERLKGGMLVVSAVIGIIAFIVGGFLFPAILRAMF